MGSKVKGFLKRFLPTSAKTSKGYTDEILYRLDSIEKRFDQQAKSDELIIKKLDALDENSKLIDGKIEESTALLQNGVKNENEEITKRLDAIYADEKLLAEEIKGTLKSESEKLYTLDTKLGSFENQIELNAKRTLEVLNASADGIVSRIDESDKKSSYIFNAIEENTKSIKSQINDGATVLSEKISDSEKALAAQISGTSNAIADRIDGVSSQLDKSDKKLTELFKSANSLENHFNEIERNFKEIEEVNDKILTYIDNFKNEIDKLFEKQYESIDARFSNSTEELVHRTNEFNRRVIDKMEKVRQTAQETNRTAAETVWAEVFNNTVAKSSWLLDKSFSPGRWAVGYPNLYVTYRVLNEIKPKKILELGLGQSTRMFSQYAAAHKGTEHIVVESDADWISFFESNYELTDHSKLMKFDYEIMQYDESTSVRVFKGLSDFAKNQKFDFITIDAPWSGDQTQLSRIDILLSIPECLSENFIILFDDCERAAENNALSKMEEKLRQYNIEFARGRYTGKKDCVILCAKHLKFLTSM